MFGVAMSKQFGNAEQPKNDVAPRSRLTEIIPFVAFCLHMPPSLAVAS